MRTRRGLLIAIEGIDAVGKKTQSRLLADWLRVRGLRSEILAFPDYTTRIGKEIRAFLRGKRSYPVELKHMLFAANRWEKFEQLQASLAKGKVLILNRYTESNLAYGKANGLSVEWLAGLERGLPKSDSVLVLDASPSLLLSRRPSSKDVFETDVSFQSRVRRAYRDLAAEFRWTVIDGTGTVQEIQRRMRETISTKLKSIGRMK